jgi:hypothetical protein
MILSINAQLYGMYKPILYIKPKPQLPRGGAELLSELDRILPYAVKLIGIYEAQYCNKFAERLKSLKQDVEKLDPKYFTEFFKPLVQGGVNTALSPLHKFDISLQAIYLNYPESDWSFIDNSIFQDGLKRIVEKVFERLIKNKCTTVESLSAYIVQCIQFQRKKMLEKMPRKFIAVPVIAESKSDEKDLFDGVKYFRDFIYKNQASSVVETEMAVSLCNLASQRKS